LNLLSNLNYVTMLNNLFLSNLLSASLLLPIAAAFSFTVGGVFMQFSEGLSRFVPSLMVYVTFLLGASLQTLATRHSGMGLTYILVLGLEAVLAVLLSAFLLQEGYSMLKLTGIFLVVMGVVFLRS
jgi:multidrug transporter EmrE-like cation transporter